MESYIHRSGRTGRAGRTGVCICFYQRKEESQLKFVEQKAVRHSQALLTIKIKLHETLKRLCLHYQCITFKRVGVPTANDIIRSSSKDAMRSDDLASEVFEILSACSPKLMCVSFVLCPRQIFGLCSGSGGGIFPWCSAWADRAAGGVGGAGGRARSYIRSHKSGAALSHQLRRCTTPLLLFQLFS